MDQFVSQCKTLKGFALQAVEVEYHFFDTFTKG